MSEARTAILEALEAARPPMSEAPEREGVPELPSDPEATLRDRVEQAGGKLQRANRDDWPGQVEWPIELAAIRHLYCGEPGLSSRGVGVDAETVHDLAPLDLCVLRGEFAVVENGAAWHVPSSPRERAAALLAEHLVILVEEHALVATLHQAYQRIDLRRIGFGWFLCGPSKTADIEQALVLGAHGPRTMSLVLLAD